MDFSPEKYVERLIEITAKKQKLLEDIFLLTMAQGQTVTEDGLDELDKLIAGKQEKLDAMNKADEEFEFYFLRLKQKLGVQSLDELSGRNIRGFKELKAAVTQAVSTIQEITGLEKQNNDKAKELLDTFAEEIKKINQGKKITTAYNPGPVNKPDAYFIDKKK